MTPNSDLRPLLRDVVRSSTPDALRAAVLRDTLHRAKARRVLRRVRYASCALGAIVALAIAWTSLRAPGTTPLQRKDQPVAIDAPIPGYLVVTTVPFHDIISTPTDLVVDTVTTTPPPLTLIDDRELLAQFSPARPILVRTGPDSQMLVLPENDRL